MNEVLSDSSLCVMFEDICSRLSWQIRAWKISRGVLAIYIFVSKFMVAVPTDLHTIHFENSKETGPQEDGR